MGFQRLVYAAFWLHIVVAFAQNTTSSSSSIASRQQNTASADSSGSDSTIFITLTSTEFDTIQPSISSPVPSSTSYTTVFLSTSTSTGTPVITDDALASALACNSAKVEWSLDYGQTAIGGDTTWSETYTRTWLSTIRAGFTETILVGNSSRAYTLCDGWPRVDISSTYRESTTVSTSLTTVSMYATASASAHVDPPSCTIAPQECEVLQSSYLAENSTYASYRSVYYDVPISSRTATYNSSITKPTPPICGVPTVTASPPGPWASLGNAACVSNGATIQLLYWPVETVGDRLCGNYSTIAPTETISGTPNTAVDFNTTFTSPTVYMVFKGAYSVAYDYGVGDNYQAILPLSSTAVSSVCGQLDGNFGAPQEIDYADFNFPVPASAYRCQPKCFGHHQQGESVDYDYSGVSANLCSTIYDNYDPALEIPTAAIKSYFTNGIGLQLHGDGQHCSYDPDIPGGIIFDPPKALQKVGSVAAPTKPGDAGPVATPATPADSPSAIPGPTKPAAAKPTEKPESNDDNQDDNEDAPEAQPADANDGSPTAVPEPTKPTPAESTDKPASGNGNNDKDDNAPVDQPVDGGDNNSPADPQPTKPTPAKPTEKPASDKENDGNNDNAPMPQPQPVDSGSSGGASDNGNAGQESVGQGTNAASSDSDPKPPQNIGDIIASGFGMLSPTQASNAASTGASEASTGGEPGGGQSSGDSSAVAHNDNDASGGDNSDDGQSPNDATDAGTPNVDIGAMIVSAANMNAQATAEATARPNGATAGSAGSGEQDAANASQGNDGEDPSGQGLGGSSSGTGAQIQQAATDDDVDDGVQVAVITGQNGRVVTATLVSSSIILPQATIAADQGPTDVLGVGRISADGNAISVDDGQIVSFTSIANVPAGKDNVDEDDDDSVGIPVLTIGDEKLTLAPAPNDNGYVLAGSSTTLTLAGTSAITLDGTTLALPSVAETAVRPPLSIVVNGQTSALATSEVSTASASSSTGSAPASNESSTTPSTTQATATQASTSPSSSEVAAGDNGAGPTAAPLWTGGALLLALTGALII